MRLWWNHVWRSHAYREATATERRLIELRFCTARAVKAIRRARGISQQELATLAQCSRNSISKMERASNRATFDIAIRCLIALGADDHELANALNPSKNPGIGILRRRAQERFFPRPAKTSNGREHRFVKKAPNVIP
jgi:transcriptional regulator with XRE-family HTH domain